MALVLVGAHARPVKPTSAGRLLLQYAAAAALLRADLALMSCGELAPQTGQSLAGRNRSIAINADSIATWPRRLWTSW